MMLEKTIPLEFAEREWGTALETREAYTQLYPNVG